MSVPKIILKSKFPLLQRNIDLCTVSNSFRLYKGKDKRTKREQICDHNGKS